MIKNATIYRIQLPQPLDVNAFDKAVEAHTFTPCGATQERGPSAELIQIRGSDDYVCREREIEPTPAEVLHRYADLSGRKL